MSKHIHIHVSKTKDAEESNTDKNAKNAMNEARRNLMSISSKVGGAGSAADNLKLKNACYKAEELIDQARRVLFDAV